MRRIQCVRHLDGQVQELVDTKKSGCDPLLEGLAFQILHCNKGSLAGLIHLVNGADVRVVQRGRGSGLSSESLECLRVFDQFLGRNLSATIRPSVVSSAL